MRKKEIQSRKTEKLFVLGIEQNDAELFYKSRKIDMSGLTFNRDELHER